MMADSTTAPASPIPPSNAAANTMEAQLMKRLQRYMEWCDFYRAKPVPEVAMAFRHSVNHLAVPASFGPLDMGPLSEMLRYDTIISSLDLHKAAIGNSGVYALADALPANTKLREINLNSNDVGEHGAVCLARGLERNTSIQRVLLRGNRIGIAGAVAFSRVLKRTRSLQFVDLSNNFLRMAGIHQIAQALVERAQARLRRALARAQAAGTAGEVPLRPEGDVARRRGAARSAAAASDSTANQSSSKDSVPTLGSGAGWVFGNISDLVVTTDFVVRTNFGHYNLPMPPLSLPRRSSAQKLGDGSTQPSAGGLRGGSMVDTGGNRHGGADHDNAAGGGQHLFGTVDAASPMHVHLPHYEFGSASPRGASVAAGVGLFTGAARPADTTPARAPGTSQSHAGVSGGGGDHHPGDDREEEIDIEVRIGGNLMKEEIINSVIHGTGLVLSLIGAVPLLTRGAELGSRWPFVPYLAGLVAFFASATLNHSLFLSNLSYVFRLVDHAAVFLLIAGTYSPFLSLNLRGIPLAPLLSLAMWMLAAVGVAVSTLLQPSKNQQRLRIVLYLLMGWLGLVPAGLLHPCLSPAAWRLLGLGGVGFSLGVALYLRDRQSAVRAPLHELRSWWYILVLLACAVHYAAVYYHARPPTQECLATAVARGLMPALPQGAEAGFGGSGVQSGTDADSAMLFTLPLDPLRSLVSPGAAAAMREQIHSLQSALFTTATGLAQSAVGAASGGRRALVESTIGALRGLVDTLEKEL